MPLGPLMAISYVLSSLIVVGHVIRREWPEDRHEQVLTSVSVLVAVAIMGGMLKLAMVIMA